MSNREQERLLFLERAVWVAAAMMTIFTALSSSRPTARGVLVGALAAASNHSAMRLILTQVIHRRGRERLLYLLFYVARFSFLVLLIAWAMKQWQTSAEGLALGFAVYPLALVMLIIRELVR